MNGASCEHQANGDICSTARSEIRSEIRSIGTLQTTSLVARLCYRQFVLVGQLGSPILFLLTRKSVELARLRFSPLCDSARAPVGSVLFVSAVS